MKVIYIAGLPRSGTTFLQSQLLQYEKVVALGEVSQTISAIKNIHNKVPKWRVRMNLKKESYWNPSTYPILHERINKDSFWGTIKDDVNATTDIRSAIELVYLKAIERYPGHTIVDASKHQNHLKKISDIASLQNKVKVLLCVRDFRGWLYSIKKHRDRINVPQRNDLVEVYKWLYSNKKLINYLGLTFKDYHKIVSYDKLVFSYSETLQKIATFCELEKKSAGENDEKFHEILGSQSFKKNSAKKDINYDSEWFSYAVSCAEAPVSAFNKKIYLNYTL